MFTIESCDVYEDITISDLFSQIEFFGDVCESDESGDSYRRNMWQIEIRSEGGYYSLDGFRLTKPEKIVKLKCSNGSIKEKILECSEEHIVRCDNPQRWMRVIDLRIGDEIVCDGLNMFVSEIEQTDEIERLFDVQVSDCHSYFANDILSHNSHFLVQLGANAMRVQKNVLYVTYELSELTIGTRFDSNLYDVDSNDVISMKDEIVKYYRDNSQSLGRLKIKQFPPGTATALTIRNHIDRLSLQGFVPHIVLVDYADDMRSTRQYNDLRHELKTIHQELRSLAVELMIPFWTASQSNKEGVNSDVIDETNMSEGFSKSFVDDIIFTLSRKPMEKSSGRGRIFLAKNRAGKDGLLYNVVIDTARSKFVVVGDQITSVEAQKTDEEETKEALRKKWKKLQEDSKLKFDSHEKVEEI